MNMFLFKNEKQTLRKIQNDVKLLHKKQVFN